MLRALLACLVLSLIGCATTGELGCKKPFLSAMRGAYDVCVSERRQQAAEEYERRPDVIAARKAEAERKEREEKAEAEWREKAHKALEPGTPKVVYDRFWQQPTAIELVDGNIRYWYDGETPYFVLFKKGKLDSLILDRETMFHRRNEALQQAAIHQQALHTAAMEEQAARDRLLQNWQNAIQNMQLSDIERNTRGR